MDVEYDDRFEAGEALAKRLEPYAGGDALVLGMARGGVAVGYAVAHALRLNLAALVVRKVGAPYNSELAIGAVSETGIQWIDYDLARTAGANQAYIERKVAEQVEEARRRQHEYSVGYSPTLVRGRVGIVVDDGIATGASALVAAESVRELGAARIILATPVASSQATGFLAPHVDEMIALDIPEPFLAVGMHYVHFNQVSDAEVISLLQSARSNFTTR